MTSLGRLTAALGVAHNENTLALANINFDFSLFRVDAPLEFRALGANLSANRRQEAETGTPHRTARKLGALFEGVLPHVPELARAYGRRVSEISSNRLYNPRENGEGGPFAAHMGADGTAIWAAATSGPGAIPVLMLACMLARIWSAPEATSLWVEIVACRRREIEINCTGDEAKDYVLLQAAQQDLTRSNLADWDASARAWLRTADEAKQLQQTQLMLITDNLNIPVSNNMNVYHSVIESSKVALVSMESILKGMSQRVQSGALLLGLSAWHLYPDMVVHGSLTKKIQQRDQLVPTGTMITLGLESIAEADMGVYWSLPLAHLRFYGDPVQSIRSTGRESSRIPAEQLIYVVLGVIFRNWVKTSSMIHLGLRWLSKIYCCIKRATQVNGRDEAAVREAECIRERFEDCGWLNILLSRVESFNKLQEHEMEVPIKLMATGFRRFEGMLDKENPLPKVFGLLNVREIFPLLRTDMVEERIRILRRVAAQQKASPAEMIIRYKRYGSPESTRVREDSGALEYYLSSRKEESYEFASALPLIRGSTKRNHSGECSRIEKHKRWIAIAWAADIYNEPDPTLPNFSPNQSSPTLCQCENVPSRSPRDNMHFEIAFDDDDTDQDLSLDLFGDVDQYDKEHEEGVCGRCACTGEEELGRAAEKKILAPLEEAGYGTRATEILANGEDCVQEDPRYFEQYYNSQPIPNIVDGEEDYSRRNYSRRYKLTNIQKEYGRHYKLAWDSEHDREKSSYLELKDVPFIYLRDGPWGTGRQSLTLIYGDEDSAALYRVSSIVPLDHIKNEIETGELESLLEQDALDVGQLIGHISDFEYHPYENLGFSLKAFASFINVYRFLPEATISLKIAHRPLHEASWARHAASRKEVYVSREYNAPTAWYWSLSLAETFACIAMFESGTYDLDPSALEHVFAVSSSNSLFVAAPLLNDPSQRDNDRMVLRVVGNIGRAGIAMLIAPQDPRIRKLESDTWELISHAPFDGKIEDSFRNTSLHLSFTQYTMPVQTGDYGGQDIETYFLESLISVYDRDKWVADLDVLNMLGSKFFQRHTYTKVCDHRHGQTPEFDLISIDNWEELLDREEVLTVVRAHRNPMARLATAAVSVRQGRPTIILPDDFCFACDVTMPSEGATTYIA